MKKAIFRERFAAVPAFHFIRAGSVRRYSELDC